MQNAVKTETNTSPSSSRNIPLEWLRICSMLMIILLHSISDSGMKEYLAEGTALYYYEAFLNALVLVCVNCFVLLSGYFMITAKFRLRKLISLWFEVVFYGFVIKLLCMMWGGTAFSLVSLLSCFFPILTGRYWFVTIYFGLYLVTPFLNIAVRAMKQRQHLMLQVILFLLFPVMVSIYPSFAGMNSGGGWGLAWFVVLYLTAAYVRLYYRPDKKGKWGFLLFFLCPALITAALWAAQKTGFAILEKMAENWWRYDSVFAYIASVALLIGFLSVHSGKSEKIKKISVSLSSATFGVYLIHNHANICTEEMWEKIGMISNMSQPWCPVHQICIVLAIFLVCAAVDLIRQKIFMGLRLGEITGMLETRITSVFMWIINRTSC